MPRTVYRFATLNKRGKRINMRTKKVTRVRNAAFQYANFHDFRITTRVTPQGVSVTRIS